MIRRWIRRYSSVMVVVTTRRGETLCRLSSTGSSGWLTVVSSIGAKRVLFKIDRTGVDLISGLVRLRTRPPRRYLRMIRILVVLSFDVDRIGNAIE